MPKSPRKRRSFDQRDDPAWNYRNYKLKQLANRGFLRVLDLIEEGTEPSASQRAGNRERRQETYELAERLARAGALDLITAGMDGEAEARTAAKTEQAAQCPGARVPGARVAADADRVAYLRQLEQQAAEDERAAVAWERLTKRRWREECERAQREGREPPERDPSVKRYMRHLAALSENHSSPPCEPQNAADDDDETTP